MVFIVFYDYIIKKICEKYLLNPLLKTRMKKKKKKKIQHLNSLGIYFKK